jgi:lipid A disaccharide synthetase
VSPVILEALQRILREQSNIELIIPTLPHLKDQIANLLSDIDAPIHLETSRENKWSVFKSCDVAIAVLLGWSWRHVACRT